MDYKYINQLLERYWKCETSLEEGIPAAFITELPLLIVITSCVNVGTVADTTENSNSSCAF